MRVCTKIRSTAAIISVCFAIVGRRFTINIVLLYQVWPRNNRDNGITLTESLSPLGAPCVPATMNIDVAKTNVAHESPDIANDAGSWSITSESGGHYRRSRLGEHIRQHCIRHRNASEFQFFPRQGNNLFFHRTRPTFLRISKMKYLHPNR